jgi:hypothetical protein
MPHRREHSPNLTVTPFIDGQFQLGYPSPTGVLFAANQPDILGGTRHAVIQQDSLAETLDIRGIGYPLHRNTVGFRNMVARMGQLKQKIAVISQKYQPFTVLVEPTHRTQHRLPADVNQICDQTPGMGIRTRRDHAARLVHGDIIAFQRRTDSSAIVHDLVRLQIHFCPQFGDNLAVNADLALCDPLLARSPGTDPGGGERFLQSLGHKKSSLLQ